MTFGINKDLRSFEFNINKVNSTVNTGNFKGLRKNNNDNRKLNESDLRCASTKAGAHQLTYTHNAAGFYSNTKPVWSQ